MIFGLIGSNSNSPSKGQNIAKYLRSNVGPYELLTMDNIIGYNAHETALEYGMKSEMISPDTIKHGNHCHIYQCLEITDRCDILIIITNMVNSNTLKPAYDSAKDQGKLVIVLNPDSIALSNQLDGYRYLIRQFKSNEKKTVRRM